MYLSKLSLVNFRNYDELELICSDSVNCISGRNGSGKTNILEAVHYLSMTKGYFSSTDTQNIKHDSQMSVIRGEFNTNGTFDTVNCCLRKNQKKQFLVNNDEYERMGDHIGKYPVVVIAPTDQILVTGGSEVRRRFMDSIIAQSNKPYLFNLLSYNHALLERNTLLKQSKLTGKVDRPSFEIWDERLAELTAPIYEFRRDFVEMFRPLFIEHLQYISGEADMVDIRYSSHLNDLDLLSELSGNLNKDIDLGFTSAGIHKDDLMLELSGHPVKKYASQGQQKSVIIALKLAQNGFLTANGPSKPVVLMDDIFDKLDEKRVGRLMERVINGDFGQLFITDTSQQRLETIFKSLDISFKLFRVENGSVTNQSIVINDDVS